MKLMSDHDRPRCWVFDLGVWEAGLGRPVVKLTVRRTHLFEDGLTSLMLKDCDVGLDGLCRSLLWVCGMRPEEADWRARFQVVFVRASGRPEQGQDAGGLFKEFWEKRLGQSVRCEGTCRPVSLEACGNSLQPRVWPLSHHG